MNLRDQFEKMRRRLSLGDLRAPRADEEEYENVGGFQLPKNFHQVAEKANAMESLAQHPGWRLVLDELEKLADARLGAVKLAENADAVTIKGLTDQWRHAERQIRILEGILLAAVEERDMMLQDLSQKYGQATDEILREAKVLGQMKAQLNREGLVAVDPEELYEEDTRV